MIVICNDRGRDKSVLIMMLFIIVFYKSHELMVKDGRKDNRCR